MSSDSAKKALGIFKWIYIIEGVFTGLLGVLFLVYQNHEALVKASDNFINTSSVQLPDGMSLAVYIGTVLCFAAVFTLIEAWLFSRAKNDGKKTTLLMVLLALSTVSGIYNLITAFGISNIISLVLTLISLYAVYVVRKEA